MPAIQLARLKIQSARLIEFANQPDQFLRNLHSLLDFYADRTLRPGQAGTPPPLSPHYNTPGPVLRQIVTDLTYRFADGNASALELADALWADGYYETHLLAITLLGLVNPSPPDPILQRIQLWATSQEDRSVTRVVLSEGSGRIQKEHPDLWMGLIKEWLNSDQLSTQSLGVRSILPIASDPGYENLPVIFDLLGPIFRIAPTGLHPELAMVIEALANRSPMETAYFLRDSLKNSSHPSISRLVRRCLPFFSPDRQNSLRQALLNRSRD